MGLIRNLTRALPKWSGWTLVLLAVLGLVVWLAVRARSGSAGEGATFEARRGPMEITVVEGGSVQALESQEIKCEVRVGFQGTKILKIVEEGYQVTEADVSQGKVLVELDSSELEKQLVQQEIQMQSAMAALTDAQKSYEIQLNQNISDIKAAEQKARFALMDFKKFLGAELAVKVVEEVGLGLTRSLDLASLMPGSFQDEPESAPASSDPKSPTVAPAETPDVPPLVSLSGAGSLPPAAGPTNPPATQVSMPDPLSEFSVSVSAYSNALAKSVLVDFAKYARLELLGDGEAKQKMRKFQDDLQVAQKELGQAKITLEGTQRLYEKGFVTRTDLQRDEIAYENSRLKVQTAETAQDLFLTYDFSKTAEETLSKYAEAVRELDRACQAAIAKLAQTAAKLRSAQAQYAVQLRQYNDLKDQRDKCTIRAQKTGLVVYGASRDNIYYFGEEQIREGATVREHQAIITIPDMTKMGVRVQIHESYIKKVKKAQKARITADAFPDVVLEGEITKVSVLPDSQNRWMNPEMKVYQTTIRIDNVQDWLKPGMSAKVEIFVDHLQDVVYVPFQCVVPENGKRYCYLAGRFKPERREVETGQFNDEFIEITRGLAEGDLVLLRPPESTAPAGEEPPAPGSPRPESSSPAPAQAKPNPASVSEGASPRSG